MAFAKRLASNEEILLKIVEFYGATFLDRYELPKPLNLALVCKAFCEPVLNLIWRNLHCLDNLFLLLPQHDGHVDAAKTTERDWITFDSYAKRVREFSVFFVTNESNLAPLLIRNKSPLFPFLRDLTISYPCISGDLFPLLVTDSLKSLVFFTSYPRHPSFATLLRSVSRRSPNLCTLHVSQHCVSKADILECLPSFKTLCDPWLGHVPAWTQDVLPIIAEFQSLSHLDVEIPDSYTPGDSLLRFGALKFLTISGSLSSLATFARAIDSGRLESLQVVLRNSLTSTSFADWLAFFSSVVSKNKTCLKEVRAGNVSIEAKLQECTLYDFLEPLASVHSLETLVFVCSDYSITITDENVDTLAKAWPNLKVFEIRSVLSGRPTIAALRSLAAQCPLLESVELDLETSGLSKEYKPSATPHRLQSLQVGHSPLKSSIVAVAMQLHCIFPLVEKVSLKSSLKDWSSLPDLMQALRCVAVSKRSA